MDTGSSYPWRRARYTHSGSLAVLGVVWASCIAYLSVEWRHNPEYHFGWLMPVMVALILWQRVRHSRFKTAANRAALPLWWVALLCLVVAAWLPVRIIGHANPDWHLVAWITFVSAMAITISVLFSIGGWLTVRQCAMPFLIIAAAVPWPFVLEQNTVAALKDVNAAVTIEALHLLGISAVRESENLIVLHNVLLGIEDGCTGIRSLHLCLAIALFWGELHQMRIVERTLLIAASLALAVVANLVRTVSLGVLADRGGEVVFESYHDLIGTLSQIVAVALCWVILLRFLHRSSTRRDRSRRADHSGAIRLKPPVSLASLARVPGWAFCVVAGYFLFAEVARTAWFDLRNVRVAPIEWSFRPPEANNGVRGLRKVALPPEWKHELAADASYSAEWDGAMGNKRALHYFRWRQGNPDSLFIDGHKPEVCLAGAGFEVVGTSRAVEFVVNGVALQMESYRFTRGATSIVIYHGIWDEGTYTQDLSASRSAGALRTVRLERAWRGERIPGRRILEVGFWDADTIEETEEGDEDASSGSDK